MQIPKSKKYLMRLIVKKIKFEENFNRRRWLNNKDSKLTDFEFGLSTDYYLDIISPELIFVYGPNTLLSKLYEMYKDHGLTILYNDNKKVEGTFNRPLTNLVKGNLMVRVENSNQIVNVIALKGKKWKENVIPADNQENLTKFYSNVVTVLPNEETYRHYGGETIAQ